MGMVKFINLSSVYKIRAILSEASYYNHGHVQIIACKLYPPNKENHRLSGYLIYRQSVNNPVRISRFFFRWAFTSPGAKFKFDENYMHAFSKQIAEFVGECKCRITLFSYLFAYFFHLQTKLPA